MFKVFFFGPVVFCRKAIAKSSQHVQANVSTSRQTDSLPPSSTVDWTVSNAVISSQPPEELMGGDGFC